jgi:hypothetical protein
MKKRKIEQVFYITTSLPVFIGLKLVLPLLKDKYGFGTFEYKLDPCKRIFGFAEFGRVMWSCDSYMLLLLCNLYALPDSVDVEMQQARNKKWARGGIN